jgi:hypothetical protein
VLSRLPFFARSVEVIRSVPSSDARELVAGRRSDFLTASGYRLFPELLRSSPQPVLGEGGTLNTERVRTKKLYYWATVGQLR